MKITEIPIEPKTEFRIKGDEDTVYIINASQRICILKNGWVGPPIDTTMPFLQRDDFEIVPDEPDIQTHGQWWGAYNEPRAGETREGLSHASFQVGNQNGKLEMYLAFKEEYEKNHKAGNFDKYGFFNALETLKPW